jgi:mannose-6-phosphate isomerase
MDSKSGVGCELSPFRLAPWFSERPWGRPNLRPWYAETGKSGLVGEAWLTGPESVIETGPMAGQTLATVVGEASEWVLGAGGGEEFPLLVKLLFPNDKLSVQVHPDDAQAQAMGQPRGKTECWYALDADRGAEVATGLKQGTTLEDVERGVHDGTLERSLTILPVTRGEMIFVDAGTVHAIWPGSILLETQQNCDITYRLYDYGRPRELHVAKAIEAIRLETEAGKVEPVEMPDRTILVERAYFCVEKVEVNRTRTGASMAGTYELARGPRAGVAYLFAASGRGRILPVETGSFEPFDLPARGMVCVPASAPLWRIEDAGGLELIRITPRWPEPASRMGA